MTKNRIQKCPGYSKKSIRVYTDGSCNATTRLGGIGYVIIYPDKNGYYTEEYSTGFSNTTNSRMEILAIIEAMRVIYDHYEDIGLDIPISVFSDSEYVVNTINKGWIYGWEKKQYKNRLNSDLWKEFMYLFRQFDNITIHHIYGHMKDNSEHTMYNNKADKLCDYNEFNNYILDIK